MLLSDLLIEVRDSSLAKLGTIDPGAVTLNATLRRGAVGEWTLALPKDHRLAAVLAQPGAGIVVSDSTRGVTLFSGPALSPELLESGGNDSSDGNKLTINGVTDEIVLADRLCYPDPANSADAQTKSYDERTGPAETVMQGLISDNAGPTAASARRNLGLRLAPNDGRGDSVTVRQRFENLLDAVNAISAKSGIFVRVVQEGASLVCYTYMGADNSRMVRFSVANGQLNTARLATSAPGATRVIGAGYSSTASRIFTERSTEASLQAEALWGRRIEQAVDLPQSKNLDELNAEADALLKEQGSTGSSARFEPSSRAADSLGKTWNLGDIVGVESNGKEFAAAVTEIAVSLDTDGLRIGAVIGDGDTFSPIASIASAVKDELGLNPIGDSGPTDAALVDAYSKATAAKTAADAAAAQAQFAQDSANGKAKVTYSTALPGNTPNNVGDVWFVKASATPSAGIVGQFEGKGGTTWELQQLRSEVIANLDAGKITAGSTFTNTLNVATTLTLGTASLNGSIQSYGYVQGGNGIYIDKANVIMKGGTISGTAISGSAVAGGVFSTSTLTGLSNTGTNHAARIQMLPSGGGGVIEAWSGDSTAPVPASIKMVVDALGKDSATRARTIISTGGASGNQAVLELASRRLSGGTASYNEYARMVAGDIVMTANGSTGSAGSGTIYLEGKVEADSLTVDLDINCFGGITAMTGSIFRGGLTVSQSPFTASGGATISSGLTVTGGATVSAGFTINSGSIIMTPLQGTGSRYLAASASGVVTANIATSSSRRFKNGIEALAVPVSSILAVEPVTYEYNDGPGVTRVGVIAEQAEEVGAGAWVYREDPDDAELVTGFDYIGFTSGLLHVAREQQSVIDDLAARIAVLEAA